MAIKKEGLPRVSYATTYYDNREIRALTRVLKRKNKMIVAGMLVKEFEEKVAGLFGKRYGVMVNSGSSANLLAMEILGLSRGSEVITPAVTFSTTLAPILQKGYTPVFADVVPETYQVNVDEVESLISRKTKAIMVPSLIGNVPDLPRLHILAKKHKLFLVEDSCDTLGATIRGKSTGVYSDISTTSFYASHIVTAAGGGGLIAVRDPERARKALVMSNWGRASTAFGVYMESENIAKRFAARIGTIPYDAKFIFEEAGYNFQPLEIQAAFGLENLKRLKKFARLRRANVRRLRAFFTDYEEFFILPRELPGVTTAWLAFPLTIRKGAPFSRLSLVKYLEEHNIQTRPLFTGNVLRQPGFRKIHARTRREGYPVADHIMRNSFLIGCHHGLTEKMVAHLFETFEDFLGQQ